MEPDPGAIAFVDLEAQRRVLGSSVGEAIDRVLQHGQYIMGPEVAELEKRLGEFCGARYVVTCSSGTDALLMVLMAWGLGRGDAVFVPGFTFAATAEAVTLAGATPVFVDVDDTTFTMDPANLADTAMVVGQLGLTPAAVIPVDLFGLPAAYREIRELALQYGMKVVGDAAQSFGGAIDGVRVGRLAEATTSSFFPAKPLGCYGDGGAVFTDDEELASSLRSIRVHGQGRDRYDSVRTGLNGRLDTLQAAVLIEKLRIFPRELADRARIAERYMEGLAGIAQVPILPDDSSSAWAQFTIVIDHRDTVAQILKGHGVPTAVYYPRPLHLQTAYEAYPRHRLGLPVSERLASHVLSLPMHPYLDIDTQDRIVDAVRQAIAMTAAG